MDVKESIGSNLRIMETQMLGDQTLRKKERHMDKRQNKNKRCVDPDRYVLMYCVDR